MLAHEPTRENLPTPCAAAVAHTGKSARITVAARAAGTGHRLLVVRKRRLLRDLVLDVVGGPRRAQV